MFGSPLDAFEEGVGDGLAGVFDGPGRLAAVGGDEVTGELVFISGKHRIRG